MVAIPSFKPTYGQNTFNLSPTAITTTLPWNHTLLPTTPLFGTDGIRGKAGELLNAPLALQIGFWAGQVLRQYSPNCGLVIMGQDTRNSGNMLGMALSAGLTAAGLEVWNLGLCPTPCVAYLTSVSEAIGGVMISASHNPPEDNGIKFFGSDGTKLSSELQKQIESGIRGMADFPAIHNNWGQHYHRPELVKEYQASLHSPLIPGHFQGMKIVLDLAWGAAVHTAPEVFQGMGAEVICLHDQPNGDRINVNCGSTHLHSLQQAVVENKADIGFAFDGDADRVLAVDSQGRSIDGDYILYFWGQSLSKAGLLPNNLIVTTVMANLGFERAWHKQGGQILRTKVGDQYVHAEMQRTGSMLGGEQSGHILCPHYGLTGDGLMTALHLAALVKSSEVSLAELVDQSFQTYPQLLRNVRVEDRDRRANWQKCEPLVRAIDEAETALADVGRVLVRASGTEPLIRVMVEAINAELASYWTENLVLAVQQYLA
ncbi:MAG: phosphoglucosamine mutase [Okeania sp. SIO2G4]|uniref:phosphoglucosamine mutase n=1 Tax=unclassified Okeania TaxID=2634635 RepID=UPI0013B9A96B|nr:MULTISPECIES: phosphoglucosamine mutase [unclassified Okeania]NEP04305.1 phosphoglucosamine mutase [Okeania sp. SIO4D6]NEP74173.1 phosphoglucosamine mutase [Okeania sp. SIO2G5]NEP95123.1 phosphoglucosamine mutase [Okeania sp. SIO2F5]NEQ93608.1 phosphoglucosamine mutase [Okeania sp. SIO2G4]